MRPRRLRCRTRPPRRPGRRRFPRPALKGGSRPPLFSRPLAPPPANYLSLVVLVESQSPIDRPLAREGVGAALGLAQGVAVDPGPQPPDKLPLHDGAAHGGDLVLGVGIEVEEIGRAHV